MKVGEVIDQAQAAIEANQHFLAMVGINPILMAGANIVIDAAQAIFDRWGSADRDSDVTQEEIDAEAATAIARTLARTAEYNKVDEEEGNDDDLS